MKHLQYIVLSLIFILGVSCSTKTAVIPSTPLAPQTDNEGHWHENMRELSRSISVLLPLSLSNQRFEDPSNKEILAKEVARYVEVSKRINKEKLVPDADPALKFVAKSFSQDIERVGVEFQAGHLQMARQLIRNSVNYCIACHSRNDRGQQSFALTFEPDLSKLKDIELAEYHAAIRQYDKALDDFDHALIKKEDVKNLKEAWGIAAKKSLAIAVRAKRNPSLALELISRLYDAKTIQGNLEAAGRVWRKDIKKWRDEERVQAKKPNTRAQNLKLAKTLIESAQRSSVKGTFDAELIPYLRASALLNDILSDEPSGKLANEALYYAGIAAAATKEVNLGLMHEVYFENCIHQQPKTALAGKCFEALSRETKNKFSGVGVPGPIQNHLDDLKKEI